MMLARMYDLSFDADRSQEQPEKVREDWHYCFHHCSLSRVGQLPALEKNKTVAE